MKSWRGLRGICTPIICERSNNGSVVVYYNKVILLTRRCINISQSDGTHIGGYREKLNLMGRDRTPLQNQ